MTPTGLTRNPKEGLDRASLRWVLEDAMAANDLVILLVGGSDWGRRWENVEAEALRAALRCCSGGLSRWSFCGSRRQIGGGETWWWVGLGVDDDRDAANWVERTAMGSDDGGRRFEDLYCWEKLEKGFEKRRG